MTIKKKHKLIIIIIIMRQRSIRNYIEIQIYKTQTKNVDILLMLCFRVVCAFLLKRISIIVVRVKRDREERLAAIARPSINDYTSLIIICISSSPPLFVVHFHALSLFLPSLDSHCCSSMNYIHSNNNLTVAICLASMRTQTYMCVQ